VKLKRAQ